MLQCKRFYPLLALRCIAPLARYYA